MRRVVGPVVLAAVIATPGIVVAATSSGHGRAAVSEYATGEIQPLSPGPVNPRPVDPRLRPTVGVVRDALEALGAARLETFAGGPGMAQILQLPKPGQRCPIFVLFQVTKQPKRALIGSPCGEGSILRGNVEVSYTPKQLGPTIRLALRSLERGNGG